MSKNFEFNAPQFINFSNMDDPGADSFFDIRTQQEQEGKSLILNSSKKLKETSSYNESYAENKDPSNKILVGASPNTKSVQGSRKVLNEIVNHQIQNETNTSLPLESSTKKKEKEILQEFDKLHITEKKLQKPNTTIKKSVVNFSETPLKLSGRKSHHMITRLDVTRQIEHNYPPINSSILKPAMMSIDQENFSPLSNDHGISAPLTTDQRISTTSNGLIPRRIKRIMSPPKSARKYISLAEQVEHFYKDTPERYRSKPSKNSTLNKPTFIAKPQACLPKTPKLVSKFRQRKVNFPDEKQREEMELEEMKKHQIKAYPLNEKILMGPSLNLKVPIIKKPATIPEPFSLTEMKKKEPHHEPVFHFKAQPLPSIILQRPVGIPPKKVTTPTIPTTPQIRVPLRLRVEVKTPEKTPSSDSLNHVRNTKIEPFSFDTKMKEMLQKKQDFIKRVIEEEKKTFSSFKAHPMPSFKNKCDLSLKSEKIHQKTLPKPLNFSQSRVDKQMTEEEANTRLTPFKAKPATVIHQKPFVPKLQKHEIVLPSDFHLNTEKRALQRQKFDEKMKQKEEEINLFLKLQKEEEERLEKLRAAEERKKAEFKAKPMPHYKAFEIHAADPEKLTLPQSPKFTSKTKDRKKLNDSVENCC